MENENVVNFDESMRRLKIVIGETSDRQVALAIGIRADSLIQLRKRGSYPYAKVIEYCKKNKVSLDYVLGNDEILVTKEVEDNLEPNNPLLGLKKSSCVFEMRTINLEQNIVLPIFDMIVYKNSHKAYIDESTIYIIDTSVGSINKNGIYLVKSNGIFYIKNVAIDFSGNFTFREKGQVDIVLKADELEKIEVIGSVVYSFSKDD